MENNQEIKPLDFVITPKGAIALIGEMTITQNITTYSLNFLGGGNPTDEKNAWWSEKELKRIDNLASLLARNLSSSCGDGEKCALKYYPIHKEDTPELNIKYSEELIIQMLIKDKYVKVSEEIIRDAVSTSFEVAINKAFNPSEMVDFYKAVINLSFDDKESE